MGGVGTMQVGKPQPGDERREGLGGGQQLDSFCRHVAYLQTESNLSLASRLLTQQVYICILYFPSVFPGKRAMTDETRGQRLKRLREAAGLTQLPLAAAAGSIGNVRNWEQG